MAAGDIIAGLTGTATAYTTDATQTTLVTRAVADSHACAYLSLIVAQDIATAATCCSWLTLVTVNASGGAATVRGSAAVGTVDPGPSGYSVTHDTSAATLRQRVTGAAGNNVRWSGMLIKLDVEHA